MVSAVGPLCARHPLAAPAYPHDPTWEEQSYLISQPLEKPRLLQVEQLTEATQLARDRRGQASGAAGLFLHDLPPCQHVALQTLDPEPT